MAPTYVYVLLGLAFMVGYVVGRLDLIAGRLAGTYGTPHPIGTPQWNAQMRSARSSVSMPETAARIEINDAKVVMPVDTSGIQKASTVELGTTTAVKDDVQAAANKLAQLKAR